MEIIFNCPHCEQELSVDAEGAGEQIKCPTCGELITIPPKSTKIPTMTASAAPPTESGGSPAGGPAGGPVNAIASSAAARVELRLKVPDHKSPAASLIEKPKVQLDAVAKGADKKLRIHTVRRAQCVEAGHDKFDEKVTAFLQQVGEANIVGIHPVSYEIFDVGTQKVMVDFGVIIVFRG
jgi:DNA-directed RNA polymerase subunit RPC12/RpoP